MSKVYKLRVLLDHEDDVFRDIEISADQSLQDLHSIILQAYSFEDNQMASFYKSNDDWERGEEYTLMDMSEGSSPLPLMSNTILNEVIQEEGEKLIYVFDFMLMWCFFVDVVSVTEIDETVILPRITQSYNEAPDQYSKDGELIFETEALTESEEPELEFEAFDVISSFDDNRLQDF